ncbi:hypothetical protein F511_33670 [Dorcoceras hygrometricum]|uniref:Uncharacterized protein n=1 Tax=Dorcoceras hygrometricum TaxID=472368 RepID=A0A2Z7CLK9_9LAMI|nr:hypothetical protein F511_33670 [Dorcoceras hygrometricum]
MAQYQILARKLLGLPGTGPKQTLEVKNSVATPPRVRGTAAPAACTACDTLPHAERASACNGCARGRLPMRTPRAGGRQVPRAIVRDNRAQWPAIGTVAARSYSATMRTLQCRRTHATVPP